MAKIRAVVKRPNRIPVVMLINGNHVGLCGLLGGLYEHIDLSGDMVAVVNISAMEYKLEKNVRIMGKQIYGPVVIVRQKGGFYESLTDEEAEQILQMIKTK